MGNPWETGLVMNFEYLRNKNRILILIVYFEKYFQTLNLVIWVPKTPQLNIIIIQANK